MVHLTNQKHSVGEWVSFSFSELSKTSLEFIEERIREADLDAFIAVDLNADYREKCKAQLQDKIEELRRSFTFSRSNMAMLGLTLYFGWIPGKRAICL